MGVNKWRYNEEDEGEGGEKAGESPRSGNGGRHYRICSSSRNKSLQPPMRRRSIEIWDDERKLLRGRGRRGVGGGG